VAVVVATAAAAPCSTVAAAPCSGAVRRHCGGAVRQRCSAVSVAAAVVAAVGCFICWLLAELLNW